PPATSLPSPRLSSRAKRGICFFFLQGNSTDLAVHQASEETGPVRNPAAEILGDGLAHISERVADTEVRPMSDARRIRENRRVFARVVGSGVHGIGVAAVIG